MTTTTMINMLVSKIFKQARKMTLIKMGKVNGMVFKCI